MNNLMVWEKTIGSKQKLFKRCALATGVVASALVLCSASVRADSATDIEQFYNVSNNVVWDAAAGDYPVITMIGSAPGVLHGHNYTGWSVFAADPSGSMDLFASQPFWNYITTNSYTTPAVGDKIQLDGWWAPFHSIPEVNFSTNANANLIAGGYQPNYIYKISSGNSVPAPQALTVSQLNAAGMGNNYTPGDLSIAGWMVRVNHVMITGTNGLTTLPGYDQGNNTVANETFTMTDNTGSMTFFDWTTSYSAAELLSGTPVGSNNFYDVIGFISYNTGGPLEFTALQIIPEPSTLMLVGTGLFGLLAIRRRRTLGSRR